MAYTIKSNIQGETCVYSRNGEHTLRDTTNALKVQTTQLRMSNRKDGPYNDDYDENEKNLAQFAVDFWKNQFKSDDVIDGSQFSLKSLDYIHDAIGDSSSDGEEDKKDTDKKTPKRTYKKPLDTLTTQYKTGSLKESDQLTLMS